MTAHSLGEQLPLWSVAPFVLLLVGVAVLELVAQRWWSSLAHKALLGVGFAGLAAAHLLVGYGSAGGWALLHSMSDYVSFILLLGALFVIATGIEVKGSLTGTPLANTAMLGVGTVLANLIGTTGAAMVLIRPFLRANSRRTSKAHLVVFFILVVANTGGLLTPLGDPPLYLGFIRGVPFEWTLGLWLPWLLVNSLVLVIFNFTDQFVLNREERARPRDGLFDQLMVHEPLRIVGVRNVLFLGAVVTAVVAKGAGVGTAGEPWPFGLLEVLLCGIAVASYFATPRAVHVANHFSLAPMASVAIIFLGIFATMTAPLLLLNARGDALGVTQPWQYFWASGGLSAVLDNAPTYLTFTSVAAGQLGVSTDDPRFLAELLQADGGGALLVAIACGSVMMGCLTYIGNGPNLMVKEIAEHRGVRMPSFFGYAVAALTVMIPVLLVLTAVVFVT